MPTPTPFASILPVAAADMITGFAARLLPTILALVVIIIPVGLTLWAVAFGIKKGINFLQKKASTAI